MSTRIDLLRRVEFPSHWPSKGVDPRSPPFELSPRPYRLSDIPNDSVFHVTEPIYVGEDRWSQVYRGTLQSSSLGTRENVVLKVFFQPYFPCSDPDASFSSPPGTFSSPTSYRHTEELLAWAEVWAYQKLGHLQGTKIPRLHGAFQVESPAIGDSQPHFAVLMSYVGGVTILERCIELGSVSDNGDTRWCSLVRDLFKQVHEFHQLGLCNLDIREANVKVVSSPEGSDSLVFFDFATARPSTFATELQKEQHKVGRALVNDLAHLRGLLLTICGDVPGWKGGPKPLFKRRWDFLQWARKEHAGDAWLKEWGSDFNCWKVD